VTKLQETSISCKSEYEYKMVCIVKRVKVRKYTKIKNCLLL